MGLMPGEVVAGGQVAVIAARGGSGGGAPGHQHLGTQHKAGGHHRHGDAPDRKSDLDLHGVSSSFLFGRGCNNPSGVMTRKCRRELWQLLTDGERQSPHGAAPKSLDTIDSTSPHSAAQPCPDHESRRFVTT